MNRPAPFAAPLPPAPGGPVVLLVTAGDDALACVADAPGTEDHVIVVARNPAEARRVAVERNPSLLLIDDAPPQIDGPSLCADLRERGAGAYVLLLAAGTDEGRLALALDSGADAFLLRPFGPVLMGACLRSGARTAAARRQARRPRRGPGGAAAPAEDHENQRRAFRVPVAVDAGLKICVAEASGRRHAARALDVSLTGLLLEAAADAPSWPVGTSLSLELQLGDDAVRLAALVHRCQGRRCALLFPSVVADGDIAAPGTLRRMVRELERHWIHTRGRP